MTIRIERHGAVAHLVLARPERLNALTPEMMEQLGEATLALQKDAGVRAVVLRGEGRAFCAGADVGHDDRLRRGRRHHPTAHREAETAKAHRG